MKMNKLEYLKSIETRQLMSWRERAYACGGYYTPFNHHSNSAMIFSIDDIKAELSTREHIPNKKEAKVIRQTKAKEKR
jgi:hypothetical protein